MNQKLLAGAGVLICIFVIIGLVLTHTQLWLFGEFAEGNHVAQDIHQGGIEPSGVDRVLGFLVGGIPVVFFTLGLLRLAQAFRMKSTGEPREQDVWVKLIRSSSRYAAAGVLGLLAYPPILSSTLSALGSLENPMIIVSAAPHFMTLAICAILFWLLAGSLGPPVNAVPRSGNSS